MKKDVVVVGAGVGGLAVAARLARRGFSVDVYEKLSEGGGRNHMLEDRGFKFDMGPSFVLMPDFFEDVFEDCGRRLPDYLDLRKLGEHYRVFFSDGDRVSVESDPEKTRASLERFEPGASEAYGRFIQETQRLYRVTRPLLTKCFTLRDMIHPGYWPLLFKLRVFESYWGLAKKYFKSEKLCFLFTFEAMFMGVSPFEAPAFYSIITYADHVQKIFHPMGGMIQIPRALERLGRELGVRHHYDEEVACVVRQNSHFLLKTSLGEREAGHVVVNADYAYAQTDLLGRRIPRYRYSCSVYLLYLGLKKKIGNLAHHNLFFSGDLHGNLKEIFGSKKISADPSFYIHVPTVTDTSLAPEGKEILYVLVPVPNLEGADDIRDHEGAIRKLVFDKIFQVSGERVEDLIEVEHRFLPRDFVARYNIRNGATFGLAHTLTQSAFLRPANIDRKVKGLYYVGASTQPGGGLPPVLAGSRIVADLIEREAREGF